MAMKIEINNRTKSQIDLNLVKQVVKKFARANKVKSKEISIAFVGDAEIKKLNQIYRKVNQATDVLAFAGERDFLGEIIIDYKQIKRQAGRFKNSAKEEMIFILTHGLLHLLGHNDKTEPERARMIKIAETFIKKNFNL